MDASKIPGRDVVAYGKVRKDGGVTIPAAVRRKLRLRAGDRIAFSAIGDEIVLHRPHARLDIAFLHMLETTLAEWESDEDERAYCDL